MIPPIPTPEETWESLLAGKSGAAPITHFDTTLFKTKFACEVKGLNINDWIDRKEARKLDRYTQLAMIAAMQGVKDANIDLEKEDLNNVGVVFGVGIGGIKTFEDIIRDPQIDPAEALVLKRRIDKSNQDRTDLVEQIDTYFRETYKDVKVQDDARINTESPAWAVDRLSILALKIYHMKEQVERPDDKAEKIATVGDAISYIEENAK